MQIKAVQLVTRHLVIARGNARVAVVKEYIPIIMCVLVLGVTLWLLN
jgi:hypothetical protein